MGSEPAVEDILHLGKGYRLVLTPTELQVQSRLAGGAWIPGRLIRYGEIRAIYRFERRNWNPLAVAATGWVMFLVLALAAGEAAGMPTWGRVLLATLPLLVVAGAGYRVYAVLSPMLKVDAFTGPLVVPSPSAGFFQRLGQRVKETAESSRAAAVAVPPQASWAPTYMPPAAYAGPAATPGYPGTMAPPAPAAPPVSVPPGSSPTAPFPPPVSEAGPPAPGPAEVATSPSPRASEAPAAAGDPERAATEAASESY